MKRNGAWALLTCAGPGALRRRGPAPGAVLLGLMLAACGGGKNGAPGAACTVEANGDGTSTMTCPDGTTTTLGGGDAGCEVSDNGDGTKSISCGDGTEVTVSDGAAGGSCSVADNSDGTSTVTCGDGTTVTVTNGQDGAACGVADNGDGTKTISCADGTTAVIADGEASGTCSVTDNEDGTKTISCGDGTTVTVADGASVATVQLHLRDPNTGADIIGATLVSDPGGVSVTTDASGIATFTDLPLGPYQFTAAAAGLELVGASIVDGAERTITTESTPVVAGAALPMELELRRLDLEKLNLVTLHTGDQTTYKASNCIACHNDRKGELSADPAVAPFHAMTTHSSLGCLGCHTTVDLENHSGANIRKQVSVSLCAGCHAAYPASF